MAPVCTLVVLFLPALTPLAPAATQLNSSLLTISVIAVILPAAFHFIVSDSDSNEAGDILKLSHGVSVSVFVGIPLITDQVAIILLFSV